MATDRLTELENQSVYIIREARHRYKDAALLWSAGKDSTALLWLCRKAFLGRIPFPVVHIDTSYKFKEIYSFRDKWAKKWGLDLRVVRNEKALKQGMSNKQGVLACCGALKTEGLKISLEKYGFEALLLGIRRDEHGIRAKERVYSPRNTSFVWDYKNQPLEMWGQSDNKGKDGHHRVHPLLDWTEADIWRYTAREKIPVIDLYFSKKGKRYRSIGCAPCCSPVPSKADTLKKIIAELEKTKTSEREGRAQDKENEYTMQKLRSLGYM